MKLIHLLLVLFLGISLIRADETQTTEEVQTGEKESDEMAADHRAEFDEYDSDKNGLITVDEIKKIVGDESDENEINEFFVQVDTDKDGNISFEEYKIAVQRWEAEAQDQEPTKEEVEEVEDVEQKDAEDV